MAWVAVEQALTTPKFGPRAPSSMATRPPHMLLMRAGIMKGDTLRGPRSSRTLCWFSMVHMPPMPEPMMTPTRSASSLVMSSLASAIACLAAQKPKCV